MNSMRKCLVVSAFLSPVLLLSLSVSVLPSLAAEADLAGSVQENVQDESMKPVSFQKASGASNSLRNVRIHSAQIKHTSSSVIGFEHPTMIQLQEGEVLVAADKTTIVKTPHSSVTVNPNAIALITVANKVTKVRNLWETGNREVRQTIGNKYVDIAAGEESILGWDQIGVNKVLVKDTLGRRRVRGIEVGDGKFMQRAEIPLSALMQPENSSVLHDIVTSENPADKDIADKIIKMSAVQQQIQVRHGQFLQYANPAK